MMAAITLARLYDSREDALTVVQALEQAGFSRNDLSVVASDASSIVVASNSANTPVVVARRGDVVATTDDEGSATEAGATIGTVLGGGAGLLAGLGAVAIPGVGPVVAAGWLIATLAGAGVGALAGGGVGGLVDALTRRGVSKADANVYAEGLRRGGTLVTVQTTTSHQAEAERIMDGRVAVDPLLRRREYEAAGWTRFDPEGPTYVRPTDRF
jgi:hypothetical protein